jgi:hypothetical protein
MDNTLLITIVLLLLVILAGGRRTTEPPTAITVMPAPTQTQGAGCADALVVGLLVLVALLLLAGRTG